VAKKSALIMPISDIDFVPPASTAGFAIIGLIRNNYLIVHIGQYKHGQIGVWA
jgi:hypothetical protein